MIKMPNDKGTNDKGMPKTKKIRALKGWRYARGWRPRRTGGRLSCPKWQRLFKWI